MRWVGPAVFFTLWTGIGVVMALDFRGLMRRMYRPGKDFWGKGYPPLWVFRLAGVFVALMGLAIWGVMIAAML